MPNRFAKPMLAAVAVVSMTCGAVPAISQDADPVADLLRTRGETYSRAPDSEQNPDEVRVTSALNAEIAAQNDLADQQEAADRAAHAETQARYEAQTAQSDADRTRYEAESRAAEAARLQYERDMADWRATVEACERGLTARCRAGSMPAIKAPY